MAAIDSALDSLAAIDQHRLRAEITSLRAIRDWALQSLHLDYQPGDRVVITSPEPSEVGGGWHHYREALAPGQTGIAGEITFNNHSQRWQCLVGMDRAWSTSERILWPNDTEVTRYWHGPASETPDSYERPGAYEQQHHPEGKARHFAMDVRWLAKAPTSAPGPASVLADGSTR